MDDNALKAWVSTSTKTGPLASQVHSIKATLAATKLHNAGHLAGCQAMVQQLDAFAKELNAETTTVTREKLVYAVVPATATEPEGLVRRIVQESEVVTKWTTMSDHPIDHGDLLRILGHKWEDFSIILEGTAEREAAEAAKSKSFRVATL